MDRDRRKKPVTKITINTRSGDCSLYYILKYINGNEISKLSSMMGSNGSTPEYNYKYVPGNNRVASLSGSNVPSYYLYNAHGDVVQLNPFRYCGEYFDEEKEKSIMHESKKSRAGVRSQNNSSNSLWIFI